VGGQDICVSVILGGGSVEGEGDQAQDLRAVGSSIARVASARGGVVGLVDQAFTSGSTLTAWLSNLTSRGRAVGVTSGADIHLTSGKVNGLGGFPKREATLAVLDCNGIERGLACLRRRGSNRSGNRERSGSDGLTIEHP
jgi:hypothetical protein